MRTHRLEDALAVGHILLGTTMTGITTQVTDVGLGRAAAGLQATLERSVPDVWPQQWVPLASKSTDADGRCGELLAAEKVRAGTYRIVFETGAYFEAAGRAAFYPEVVVTFAVERDGSGCHLPLLLSAFGYSTCRGA